MQSVQFARAMRDQLATAGIRRRPTSAPTGSTYSDIAGLNLAQYPSIPSRWATQKNPIDSLMESQDGRQKYAADAVVQGRGGLPRPSRPGPASQLSRRPF